MISKPESPHKVPTIMRSRYALGAMLCSLVVAAVIVVIPITRGANPASGTVSEANSKVTWTGQIKTPTGDSNCGSANNAGCDNFVVNFQAPSAGYGPYLLEIKLQPQGVNPSGLTLQTVDASNGTAVLNASVTQTGVYVIKVINVSLGPLQVITTTTPLVKR